MRILTLLFLSILSFSAYSAQDEYEFANAERAATFKALTQELRCPKCQNQNIADSDAIVAKDLRDKVLVLVNEGKSKQEVIDYMIDRYGYFVHYQPPVTPATIVLWVLPVLIVIIGFGFIVFRQKKASKKQKWNAQDEEKLAQLIKQYQRQEHNS
ncbi:cytochrome c-type biogenesis protein [Pseudoalteromonas sp. SS15]|uniref:Cytochrome c-type biogenesis protein n=1 Tax=Pseudoalteromonas phenolica TaxID=161398 RepID=A0A0S2K0F3_9GAMM|nr:cytochrome c-type biogenesis protein [Pseudoalteromonas phenolica]ALO41490.1 Cytochrome C biogenesis protein CcmH [Pseudoalteromonas phenolica]MBE0353963.1 cytochrome c-type biogenesis protein CcmH [Pseudoalteromonas phenolica O-BC30]RXF03890.1 cytochrome c-type biogenesis protein CcmH [Pseudoalteromonas phenolica O-BC30]RZQ53000.1 cytochrome c-type biogenesis protein CcmH [Pseudoalteromonas phenolica]TMO57530.1 cytochrome c-type biogenesis protein CcmH [Pseudoalteromonas phenolica]|tara:strand:- start:198 stop:662 length:465 start_codon:yes stop_codon:yes gene_type:complete